MASDQHRRAAATRNVVGVTLALIVVAIMVAVALVPNFDLLNSVDIETHPSEAVLDARNMAPGDTTEGTLVVSNAGTVPLRYAMVTATTDDGSGLDDALVLTVRTADTAGDTCTSDDGALLYEGPLSRAHFGSAVPGGHDGDRELGPAGSERLCLRATLPEMLDNIYQHATASVTFEFIAERGDTH